MAAEHRTTEHTLAAGTADRGTVTDGDVHDGLGHDGTAPFLDLVGAEVPAPPRYGQAAVADVLESAATLLRPVQEARGLGLEDRLGLPELLEAAGRPVGPFRNVCVVLVDGLGAELVRSHQAYAPALRAAASLAVLDAAFPSTTAVSLAALGTGLPAGQTGMVGYDVVDPSRRTVVNQLSGWDPAVDPQQWQPQATVFQRLQDQVDVVTVSKPAYADSPLTRAALRGGRFLPTGSTVARISKAAEVLGTREPTLMYLYWPELDQTGHRHGVGSRRWEEALEDLESGLRRLKSRVGEETLLLLTADHGMVDVAEENRIDYRAIPELVQGVELTAGEPRMVQLHLQDPEDQAVRDRLVRAWSEHFGEKIWIIDRDQALAAGYFGAVREGVRERIGDLLVAARGPLALYDLERVPRRALEMVGQHGSWTRAEREVPLLAL